MKQEGTALNVKDSEWRIEQRGKGMSNEKQNLNKGGIAHSMGKSCSAEGKKVNLCNVLNFLKDTSLDLTQ